MCVCVCVCVWPILCVHALSGPPDHPLHTQDDFEALNPTLRVCWQYGGLVLGVLAIGGIIFPFLWEDWEPHPMWQIPWMLLLLGALCVHETRPYKVRSLAADSWRCRAQGWRLQQGKGTSAGVSCTYAAFKAQRLHTFCLGPQL